MAEAELDQEILDAEEPESDDSAPEAVSDDPLEGREDLQKCLYDLYLKCCEEDRYARIMEVKDVQQACLYWRGLQYWWWSNSDSCWRLPNQQHGLITAPLSVDDMPRFQFVTNIYQAFGLSLVAAMAQAPPRTRFFPDDADDPLDVETAEGYTSLAKIIERWNPIQVQLQDEVYHLFTGGTVGAWVRHVSDDKFGTEEIEDFEEESIAEPDQVRCAKCGFTAPADLDNFLAECAKCGAPLNEDNIVPGGTATVPTSSGTSEVPKGREIVTVRGALNLKRPLYVQDQADWHYFAYEEELHYARIRQAYPDIATKIKPGAGNGENNWFERNARLTVMSGAPCEVQTGESWTVTTTFARVWFDPAAFYMEGVTKEFREELLDIFPNGCRVYFAGPQYCESKEEDFREAWVIAHAMPGDGQHKPGLGSSMISAQDRYNTWSNIEAETYEYGIPITYRAADTWDANASEDQVAEPGAEIDVQLDKNADIRMRIMQLRNDQPSPAMLQSMQNLMGPVSQFLTGAFPALLGAGAAQGAAGDTAAGYKMQMDQALGRCGISYVRLKQFHADIQTLACKDFCRNVQGKTSMSKLGRGGDFENEAVDTAALQGNARAYPEGDENFPELWNQQRAVMMDILKTAPGQQLLTEPDNAELAVKAFGIPGLVLPGSDARNYALDVIGMLTETQELIGPDGTVTEDAPILPPQAIMAMIDPLEDHATAATVGKRWLFTQVGRKCKRETPQAWANVHAWTTAQAGMVPPPPPVPEKPLSKTLTVAVDKMPPEAQAQILAKEYAVDLSPEDFVAQAVLDHLKKNAKPTQAPQGLPGQPGNPAVPGSGVTHA